jgi:phosphohistidine phosphatase
MEIYLQRHGIAEWGHTGLRDADRALTDEGIARLKSILKVARAAGVKPSLVLTSPYRRAVETAQLAADILGCKGEMVRADALKPMADPREVWEEIRLHKGEESIYLAGPNRCSAASRHSSQVRLRCKWTSKKARLCASTSTASARNRRAY